MRMFFKDVRMTMMLSLMVRRSVFVKYYFFHLINLFLKFALKMELFISQGQPCHLQACARTAIVLVSVTFCDEKQKCILSLAQ